MLFWAGLGWALLCCVVLIIVIVIVIEVGLEAVLTTHVASTMFHGPIEFDAVLLS